MGKGDWMPLIIIALFALLAIPFPRVVAGVDAVWFLLITVGMTRAAWRAARAERMRLVKLCMAFNIPSAVIALIVWLRW